MLSATIFALSVGVFLRNNGHLHIGCFSLQATQFDGVVDGFDLDSVVACLVDVVEAKTFDPVLVLVTDRGCHFFQLFAFRTLLSFSFHLTR